MKKVLNFYFDFGSPTAYLAHTQLQRFAETYDLEVVYEPMLLGALLKANNNLPPAAVPAKGRYMLKYDLPRFVKRYQVPFKMNPHFPINTLHLMRGCFTAEEMGCFKQYVELMFRAMWVDALNMGDLEQVESVMQGAGLDSGTLLALCEREEIKNKLKSHTNNAIEKGVFGAPTFYLGEEMFFGQDRLDFIEAALQD